MSRKASERQEGRKNAHQPEYTIIKRAHRPHSGMQPYHTAPAKTRPGKKSAALEEKLSKRELLREKQYDARRRRQWALALGVIILFVGGAAAALHFITNRPTTTTANTACNTTLPNTTGTTATINQTVQDSLASMLGISTSTLQADLAAGETLADIAAAQNKQMSDVNTAYLNALQNELDTLVSANEMTQDQATQLYTQEQTNVNSGNYTYLQTTNTAGFGRSGPCPSPTSDSAVS